MSTHLPIAVRLTPAYARSRTSLGALLVRAAGVRARAHEAAWRLTSREWAFARRVLLRCTRLWLWRTDPKAFAGDFLVVDMSSPRPARRALWVVDLKCQAPLKLGGGGAGVSLTRADRAAAWLDAQGVVSLPSPTLATGDGRVLMTLWQRRRWIW